MEGAKTAVYHVFVASPGDVGRERDAVYAYFERYNRGAARTADVRFEVIGWETDASAGAGRAQAVVTRDTLERFRDSLVLFIGIMAQRIGTPTGGHAAATLEEHEWALAAREASGQPEIKWFFRNLETFEAPADLTKIEDALAQWQQVVAFRGQLESNEAALFKLYPDADRFAKVLATDLDLWLADPARPWHETGASGEAQTAPTPSASPQEAERLRTDYLRWVLDRTRDLSLGGVDPKAAQDADTRLELRAVYTALETRTPRRVEDRVASERMAQPRGDEPPLSAVEALDRFEHLVLLGDPGSGKSTFVDFVAHCHAGALLEGTDADLEVLTGPLPNEDGEPREQAQDWSHGPRLPVRVVLRDFAAAGLAGEPDAGTLWAFVGSTLPDAEATPVLQAELADAGGLVLLDGLDEVPDAERTRERVLAAISAFARAYDRCRVLVTCRPYAYQRRDWRLADFADAELAPLGDGQVRWFVRRWYDHAAFLGDFDEETAAGRAALLEQTLLGQPRLRELAERPLLLTLIASLHAWRGGSLPEKREALYADAVDLLLDLWDRRRVRHRDGSAEVEPSLAEFLKIGKARVRDVLERVAFDAHSRARDAESDTADIAEDALVAALTSAGKASKANTHLLVDYLRDRAGLVIARGPGVYAFVHRTFQEYLAACRLTDDDFPRKIAALGRSAPERWREVVLLAGAKAASGGDFAAWSLAEELCPDPLAEDADDGVAWGAQLAAQVLVESARLGEQSRSNRRRLERIRDSLVTLMHRDAFPMTERALAGRSLAALGDPRPGVGVGEDGLPDIDWVTIPGGSFVYQDGERREVEAFAIARYPVTNAQFRCFVEDPEGFASPAWWEGLAQTFESPMPAWMGYDNHPRVRVSWYEAVAFCRWLSARSGLSVRLPREEEWERAARGTDGREYPWGEGYRSGLANIDETFGNGPLYLASTTAVGLYLHGKTSDTDIFDLAGNALEWCANEYGTPSNVDPSGKERRVLRGGSWSGAAGFCRAAARGGGPPDYRLNDFGFRVLCSPPSPE